MGVPDYSTAETAVPIMTPSLLPNYSAPFMHRPITIQLSRIFSPISGQYRQIVVIRNWSVHQWLEIHSVMCSRSVGTDFLHVDVNN